MKTTVKISGMSCMHCVMSVKNALKTVPGLKNMDVTIGQAVVETEGPVDQKVLKDVIEEEGYEVVAIA